MNRDASVLDILRQNRNQISSDCNGLALVIDRTVNPLDACAAELCDVVQRCTDRIQPVNRICAVLAERLHQFRIIDALAADHPHCS